LAKYVHVANLLSLVKFSLIMLP